MTQILSSYAYFSSSICLEEGMILISQFFEPCFKADSKDISFSFKSTFSCESRLLSIMISSANLKVVSSDFIFVRSWSKLFEGFNTDFNGLESF